MMYWGKVKKDWIYFSAFSLSIMKHNQQLSAKLNSDNLFIDLRLVCLDKFCSDPHDFMVKKIILFNQIWYFDFLVGCFLYQY